MAYRTFFAIDLPAEARPKLEPLSRQLASMGARTSALENLHITALFLGESVDGGTIAAAKKVLSEVRFQTFTCGVSCLGVFTDDRPRVVFGKITSGSEELFKLNSLLWGGLSKAGINTETRYHPHLTLARVKRGADVDGMMELVGKSREPEFGFMCKELKLKQTHDSPTGMLYEDLGSISLA